MMRWIMLLSLVIAGEVSAEVLQLNYDGFTLWLDCDQRMAVRYHYVAGHDIEDRERKSAFYTDPNVPRRCQQKSTSTYRRAKGLTPKYDRGHLVAANHVEHSELALKQSNYITNVVPQVAQANRGAIYQTELITECYRDIEPVKVYGGIVFDRSHDHAADYFLRSHGVETPDAFWKVLVRENRVIAWLIPNSSEATRKVLDRYLVSVRDVERLTGFPIPVTDYLKDARPETSWYIPRGCDVG